MKKLVHAKRLVSMLIGLCCVLSAPAWTHPQGPTRKATSEARKRWEGFSAEEKRKLRSHFEQLEQLDSAQRRELEQRARWLLTQRENARRRLPSELQGKLEGLAGEQRRQVIEEFVRAELQRRGSRIRDKLPPEWVERLEAAQPAQRPGLMRKLREQMRRESDARALQQMSESLRLDPERMRELRSLSPEQRQEAMLGLRRKQIEAKVESRGIPRGISSAEWAAWRELSTPEFFELWHERTAFSHSRGQAARLRPKTAQALRRALQPDPSWRKEWRAFSATERRKKLEARLIERAVRVLEGSGELEPDELARFLALDYGAFREGMRGLLGGNVPGPSAPGERSGERQSAGLEPATHAALQRAMRLDPEWVIEFAELPAAERAQRMQERQRARVLEVLEAAPEVDSRDLDRLRALSGREFREAVRRFAQRLAAQRRKR